MSNPVHEIILRRASTGLLQPGISISRDVIERLVGLATRAPSAFNLQNWRFVIVDTLDAKRRLRAAAYDQAKVTDAATVVIIVGTTPDPTRLRRDLGEAVSAGILPADLENVWVEQARGKYGGNPQAERDEAICSASLAAATLLIAVEAEGLESCPMNGFDPAGVARGFGLSDGEIPVMLVAIGKAAPQSWPQKPRRSLSRVMSYA